MRASLPINVLPESSLRDAYGRALQYETTHQQDTEKSMRARLLGYLILEALVPEAQNHTANAINVCQSDDALFALSEIYLKHFIQFRERALYVYQPVLTGTPVILTTRLCHLTLAEHSSRPSLCAESDSTQLQESPRGDGTAKTLVRLLIFTILCITS